MFLRRWSLTLVKGIYQIPLRETQLYSPMLAVMVHNGWPRAVLLKFSALGRSSDMYYLLIDMVLVGSGLVSDSAQE